MSLWLALLKSYPVVSLLMRYRIPFEIIVVIVKEIVWKLRR